MTNALGSHLYNSPFLRGLVAAAIASQIVDLPAAEAEARIDHITDRIGVIVNGERLRWTSVEDMGGGWFRVAARCIKGDGGLGMDMTGLPGGGLFIGSPEACEEQLREYPNIICVTNMDITSNHMRARGTHHDCGHVEEGRTNFHPTSYALNPSIELGEGEYTFSMFVKAA